MKTAHAPEPCRDVYLWFAKVAELDDPGIFATSWAVLSCDEKQQAARFHFECDRNTFVASRSLRRHVLSHYADVEPHQWQFISNRHGRPRIAQPVAGKPIEFNTSKSGDIAVCAVTCGIRVGIDIERADRSLPAGVTESAFTPGEIAAIQKLPLSDRNQRYISHWTLKEAYLKARGIGLSIPLDSIAFQISGSPCQKVYLESSPATDCDAWQFTLLSPTPSHVAAVCIPRQHGLETRVVMRLISAARIPQ